MSTHVRTHPSTPPRSAPPAEPAGRAGPGFYLYVSLPDEAGDATTSPSVARAAAAARLVDAADVLRELALDLLPDAETVTQLALVPAVPR